MAPGAVVAQARAEKSIAFEDLLSAVRAAVAAGLAVVGLTSSLDARLVADFTDVRIAALIERRMAAREQPQLWRCAGLPRRSGHGYS